MDIDVVSADAETKTKDGVHTGWFESLAIGWSRGYGGALAGEMMQV